MEPDFRQAGGGCKRAGVLSTGALSTHTKQDRIYIDSRSRRMGGWKSVFRGVAAGTEDVYASRWTRAGARDQDDEQTPPLVAARLMLLTRGG